MNANDSRKGEIIVFAIFISIAFILSAYLISSAISDFTKAKQTIYVKGYAEKAIKSDLGNWTGSVAVKKATVKEAYSQMEIDLEKVISFLESKGFNRKEIEVSAINVMPNYALNQNGNPTSQIISYTITRNVSVGSTDVEKINSLPNLFSELIYQDLDVTSYAPSFYYTKLNDLKISMLATATKDARNRAEQLAENGGSKIGALATAQQGIFQITSSNSTEVSDYGEYDTYSINKTIKAVVSVEYYVK